ncbi:hypothetical protein MLD38_010382 [Melastoma candidum]|uniref:Uncharacterized protein n=1 Tax=Melastoma candidum TaxID=119954 RepID=A0ACB9QZM2_9MYRT|nr:hypothetical protein MLD38_010382 [Melastoma candidum]
MLREGWEEEDLLHPAAKREGGRAATGGTAEGKGPARKAAGARASGGPDRGVGKDRSAAEEGQRGRVAVESPGSVVGASGWMEAVAAGHWAWGTGKPGGGPERGKHGAVEGDSRLVLGGGLGAPLSVLELAEVTVNQGSGGKLLGRRRWFWEGTATVAGTRGLQLVGWRCCGVVSRPWRAGSAGETGSRCWTPSLPKSSLLQPPTLSLKMSIFTAGRLGLLQDGYLRMKEADKPKKGSLSVCLEGGGLRRCCRGERSWSLVVVDEAGAAVKDQRRCRCVWGSWSPPQLEFQCIPAETSNAVEAACSLECDLLHAAVMVCSTWVDRQKGAPSRHMSDYLGSGQVRSDPLVLDRWKTTAATLERNGDGGRRLEEASSFSDHLAAVTKSAENPVQNAHVTLTDPMTADLDADVALAGPKTAAVEADAASAGLAAAF